MARKGGKDRGILEVPPASGIWWARYYVDGKEYRERCGAKSLARDVHQKRRNEIREGRFFPAERRRKDAPLAVVIAEVLASRADRKGYRNIKRSAARLVRAFGDSTPRGLTDTQVTEYRVRRRGDGVGEQTIYHELSFLRTVMRFAVAHGYAERQVVTKLTAPKAHRLRYLSDEEEGQLFAELPVRWHPHVALALHTGMRQGEQFALRWRQVDFLARVVRLPETKGEPPRTVDLNERAVAALRGLPRRLGRAERADWVFTGERCHRKLNQRNFYRRVFVPALRRAGVTDFTWHDLRHTFASRLVMAGVEIPTVSRLLGHRSITMTMRYAHLRPGATAAAVKLLADRPTVTVTGKAEDVG